MNLNNAIAKGIRFIYDHFTTQTLRQRIACQTAPLATVQGYWREPGANNMPEKYLEKMECSKFLLEIVSRYMPLSGHILEIGCNAGRNLDCLYQAGYRALAGVEINIGAAELFRKTFPDVAKNTQVLSRSVEEAIQGMEDDSFDLIFTMAVLQHIHPKSEWVFKKMMRVCKKYLITIENEQTATWLLFPRNYKQIFESLGMVQVEEVPCRVVGLSPFYKARVFEKERRKKG